MATLAQLKTRIILETDRDDMGSGGEAEQTLIDAYTDAIDYYSSEQFWFNRANGSGNTAASTATIAMPTGVRFPRAVTYLGEPLTMVDLIEVQARTETGIPSKWAENEGAIQLWPIPGGVYAIGVYGLASTGVPAAAGDSNIWTTEAYKLIVARSKVTIFRIFKEYDALGQAAAEELEAMSALRKETRRRGMTNLVTDLATGTSFNINLGY